MHACIHAYIHTYIHTYINTYIHTCIYIYDRHPATESAHAHVPRRRQLLTRACRKSRGRARDRKRSASCPRQLQPAPCACAPNAASGSHSGCRAGRGCSQRTCGQHQSAEHMGRRRRRHCRCARPVPPNASLLQTGGAHGAAAGGQAAPPDDLAEGPAPFYRRLRRSPPRCTSGYTARQLSGCALRVRTPCAPPSPLSGPLPGSAWGRVPALAAAPPRPQLVARAALRSPDRPLLAAAPPHPQLVSRAALRRGGKA